MVSTGKRKRGPFVLAAAVAAGCSGGGSEGDVDPPAAVVSFTASSGSMAESAGQATATVVLATAGGPLTREVTVDVVDAGAGTATSGSDYLAFTPQRVTFPEGSVDGATAQVTLTSLADALAEGLDETVVLALQGASGALAQGLTQHTVSIADADSVAVAFTSGASATADESATIHGITVRLDLSAGATLAFDVDLVASDDGTGSASPGSDYAAVGSQPVVFPAGSVDGQTVTVNVQVLDDSEVEGPEVVAVELGGPDLAAVTGAGPLRHVVTIVDDDAPPAPLFVATSGPTGTETSHASGDVLDLGVQLDGIGPNAGTLVRVSNQGGGPMQLGTPVLGGAHASDFSVEVAGTSLPAGLGAPADVIDLATPFVRRAALPDGEVDPLPGVALVLDEAATGAMAELAAVRLHGVPLPGLGEVTLALERRPLPFSPDAVLRVDGQWVTGGPAALVSDLTLWSGEVVEVPGSRVFLALGPQGPEGRVEMPYGIGHMIHLTTETPPSAAGDPAQVRVVHEADLEGLPAFDRPPLCGGDVLVPGDVRSTDPGPETAGFAPPVAGLVTTADCRLALETDYQFFQKFGSSSDLTNYVTALVAAVSDQYVEDVQTTLSVAYLGIHTTSSDPWTTPDGGGDTADMLSEFRGAWNTSGWPVSADLAHFLSGASLGGGIAYVNVLCNQGYGYGVSANLRGNINWSTWTGNAGSFTWDFVVLAHELGHNFGASHTHDYCPPLDTCYANCQSGTACSQGTLMSYCHTCGGMDNIDLHFHPNVANIMRQRVDSSCLGDATLGAGDAVTYRVRFSPDSGAGAKSATLTVDHDAANASDPFVLNLSATAQ